jgi:phosphotransferase system HPr (HPr) family protein
MIQQKMRIKTEVGLHARPAALFVQQAGEFASDLMMRNLSTNSEWVDAKSILSVMTLGVEMNHEIELRAEGADEQQAVAALTALVDSRFGEL